MSETETRDKKRGRPRARESKPGARPTLRTIAEMTGLAITTISRALNNAPELSDETRLRVQKIAAEIGYVPDRTALRLKTGRTHVIGLILDPHDEILGFGQSMVSGITAALRDTAYHLVITANFRNATPLDPIRYLLRNKAADGVIFSRTEPDDARVKLLLEENFPFVSHGRTMSPVPHPFVDYDNAAFANHAVRRLKAKGCRKVTIILPPMRFSFGHHLRDGFMAAVTEAGLDWEILSGATLDSAPDDIRLAVMRRLREPAAPDGFVCTGDASALAVMAGITDAGRTIGRDVQVVAKQTSTIFSQVRPMVDALFEDTALAGQQMGELLLKRIHGQPAETLQILHQPEVWF
ncbi:MAG: LacI family transcriptional regulator [Devosia sp.]|nr:LacI family transcriptional regulator [Devosia sp.]